MVCLEPDGGHWKKVGGRPATIEQIFRETVRATGGGSPQASSQAALRAGPTEANSQLAWHEAKSAEAAASPVVLRTVPGCDPRVTTFVLQVSAYASLIDLSEV